MSTHISVPGSLSDVVAFVENVSETYIRRIRENWHVETDFWGEHISLDKTKTRFHPNTHLYETYRSLCHQGFYPDLIARSDELMARVMMINGPWAMLKTDVVNADLMNDILTGQYFPAPQTDFIVTVKRSEWNDNSGRDKAFRPVLNAALQEYQMRSNAQRFF